MFTHILIPIDGDSGSRRVIELGVTIAKKIGTRVAGFHAMAEFSHTGIVDELMAPRGCRSMVRLAPGSQTQQALDHSGVSVLVSR